jgi:large subunit ribosomal protein L5
MYQEINGNKMNKMREIRIEKITLNLGAGKSQEKIEKGLKLFEVITGKKPVKTITNKRIAGWGLRPGLPIGCKVTIRGAEAVKLAKRLLTAIDNKLKPVQFDERGNIAFGLLEYIDIPEVDYDPAIGALGFQVCITLTRPGYRIRKRRLQSGIGKKHFINKNEAVEFMKKQFNLQVEA